MKPLLHPLLFTQTTFSILLVLAMQSYLTPTNALDNETDYMALLAIKDKLINRSRDGVMRSWNSSLHHCFWEGVTCERKHNRVIELELVAKGLKGTISPFIGNLSFLRKIWFSYNRLHGQIPHEIGRLFKLRSLFLQNNYLSGRIPSNISTCTNLKWLLISSNKLSGMIPPSISNLSSLVGLDLSNNQLRGELPMELGALSNLKVLWAYSNKLSGMIPSSISNLSYLQQLFLYSNQLQGKLPIGLGSLSNLKKLVAHNNNFNGGIPPSIFNLSSLIILDLGFNELQGSIPLDIAFNIPRLRILSLSSNYLRGPLPISLQNLTKNLKELQLNNNYFIGNLPVHLGRLHNLEILNVASNKFVGDIGFIISALINCTKLESLHLQINRFTGTLPKVVANLSTHLTELGIGRNPITGEIPIGIGNLINLMHIIMDKSNLIGSIPNDIGKLQKLVNLYLNSNSLTGEIPNTFTNLSLLSKLYLNDNKLHGKLPPTLGNCANLLFLDLSSNKLNGSLPNKLFAKTNFIALILSQNHLEGSLPTKICNQISLEVFCVSNNYFSGKIPNVFSNLLDLQALYLDHNFFKGPIPPSFSSLKSLLVINISHNNLSGPIPQYLSSFPLICIDFSYNIFEGKVPTNGVFANANVVHLVGNSKLCGGNLKLHLPRCNEKDRKKRIIMSRVRVRVLKSTIIPIVCAFVGVLALAMCIWLYLRGYSKKRKLNSANTQVKESFSKVSYDMLLKATDGFSPETLIGSGTYGSVFKGTFDGETVAIKVLDLQQRGGLKSFMAECEALRNIRHRNLVGIITACSSIDFQRNDFKALVYEFMPNGSLDRWLHEDGNLSLLQRVDVAIDVANALNYLHNECGSSIVHCDLKPSNILLDYDMVSHVSDFGLAKILAQPLHPNQSSSIGVRGTVGYIAPEYGLGGEVSLAADLYSYGIVLLELMTRKRPTDDMFKEDFNLHMYAKAALPDQVLQIVDMAAVEHETEEADSSRGLRSQEILRKQEECIMVIMKIGVSCSNQLPKDRMIISAAINELQKARKTLLNPRRRHNIPRGNRHGHS